jgi:hypothetical protein
MLVRIVSLGCVSSARYIYIYMRYGITYMVDIYSIYLAGMTEMRTCVYMMDMLVTILW